MPQASKVFFIVGGYWKMALRLAMEIAPHGIGICV